MPYKDPEQRKAKQREYMHRWYARPENKARQLKMNAAIKARVIAVFDDIKSGPCTDCGNHFPPCAMDFDHVRGTKLANVSVAVRSGNKRLSAIELEKCELVCANCHRVRTHARRFSRRLDGQA